MSTALKILVWMMANKDALTAIVQGGEQLLENVPGDTKAAAVRDFIREAMDMTDPDDKSWEPAWRIVRPFFNLFVAKVKGKIPAAA